MTGALIRGDLDRDATEGRPCEDTWRRCLLQLKRGCNRSFPHDPHKESIHQYTDLRLSASRKVRKQVSVVYNIQSVELCYGSPRKLIQVGKQVTGPPTSIWHTSTYFLCTVVLKSRWYFYPLCRELNSMKEVQSLPQVILGGRLQPDFRSNINGL